MSRAKDGTGFSLVEVLIASVVFCVGLAGVFPLIAGSVRASRTARDASMATWLAWQKLEELRSVDDLAVSPADTLAADSAGFVDYRDGLGRDAAAPDLFTRRWLVEPAPGADAIRIVVRVHHAAAPGVPVIIATVRLRRLA
jgi:prepilin-type N-terminal cleavage/methylation domain-containing protein